MNVVVMHLMLRCIVVRMWSAEHTHSIGWPILGITSGFAISEVPLVETCLPQEEILTWHVKAVKLLVEARR